MHSKNTLISIKVVFYMDTIKSIAHLVSLHIDPGEVWTRIDMIVGESFRTVNKNAFHLNETPNIDASLVPFSNVSITAKKMTFEAQTTGANTLFEIDLSKNRAAYNAASFIEQYNAQNYKIETGYKNSIQIKFEKKYFTLRLENIGLSDLNIENKNWLIISFNKHGHYVQIKEPFSDQKRFEKIKAINFDNLKFSVICAGGDVWNENDKNTDDFPYSWELNVQPEFIEIVSQLIKYGIAQQH
jgi:hypothetical protein